jgi:hypothetical protein
MGWPARNYMEMETIPLIEAEIARKALMERNAPARK